MKNKIIVTNSQMIFYMMAYSHKDHLILDEYFDLIDYIYEELINRKILDNYKIYLCPNTLAVINSILLHPSFLTPNFRIESDLVSEYYYTDGSSKPLAYLKNDIDKILIAEKYASLDLTIKEIIENYYQKEDKKELKMQMKNVE